jgi:hypothetical protein
VLFANKGCVICHNIYCDATTIRDKCISDVNIFVNIIFIYKTRDSVVGCFTGWTTNWSEFESRWGQEFLLIHVVQIGSGVHPTSYPMGTRGSFPGAKVTGA